MLLADLPKRHQEYTTTFFESEREKEEPALQITALSLSVPLRKSSHVHCGKDPQLTQDPQSQLNNSNAGVWFSLM